MAADSIVRKMSKSEAEWFIQNSRENAVWDYNFFMYHAKKKAQNEGHEKGLKEGLKEGLEEGLKEGHEVGLKEGLAQGEHNKACKVAKILKQAGIDISLITKSTGLSPEEIATL